MSSKGKGPARAGNVAAAGAARPDTAGTLFALAAGIWVSISMVKLGNPVIFEQMLTPPRGLAEFLLISWPIWWGYVLLGALVLAAIPLIRFFWRPGFWPIALLGFWLCWQFFSATKSVSANLTNETLVHFVSCGICFALGCWVLSRRRLDGWFWVPVIAGMIFILFAGFDQHNGGLEAMRKSFHEQPGWELYPKEYKLKIESNRIFATMVYPNALAQLLLLMFPAVVFETWRATGRFPRVLRGVVSGLLIYLGIACFFWTGSKGGWLIALIAAALVFLHLKLSPKLKVTVVAAGIVLGLVGFFLRFSGYFERGATSVGARFSYWRAAAVTAKSHPVFGTGPGTFSIAYRQLKAPDEEMAKLTHNDYLEQASDSGFPGFIAFFTFIWGSLITLYRKSKPPDWSLFLIWTGLVAWALQSFIEFGLYIPASAWPMFLLVGYLWGRTAEMSANE